MTRKATSPIAPALLASLFLLRSALGTEEFVLSMPAWVAGAAFSPDSKQLAIACADGCAHLMDVQSRKETALLRGHQDYVACVAFAPDAKTLATGSYDHTARLWELDSK